MKIKIKIIIILSFFAFDKLNFECTKLLNSHYVLSHSPVSQTVEDNPLLLQRLISYFFYSVSTLERKTPSWNQGVRHRSTDAHPWLKYIQILSLPYSTVQQLLLHTQHYNSKYVTIPTLH